MKNTGIPKFANTKRDTINAKPNRIGANIRTNKRSKIRFIKILSIFDIYISQPRPKLPGLIDCALDPPNLTASRITFSNSEVSISE